MPSTPNTTPSEALARIEPGGELAITGADRERVRRILADGTAPNTRRALAGDLRYFERWHELRTGALFTWPLSVDAVLLFVADHLEGLPEAVDAALVAEGAKAAPGPHSLATVQRRVSSLSQAHRLQQLPNPCQAEPVRQLLSKARKRAARRGETPSRKAAATRDVLDEMLAACGDDLSGLRDRALLLFAFASGGRRRSEVAVARVDDLTAVDGGYLYTLRRSKTDQTGEGVELPILGRAAAALNDWLEAAGIADGPVFRAVDRWGNVGGRMSGRAVGEAVKRCASAAGLDAKDFGGHSLRRGFITEAGRRGVSLGDAMALSGHRTIAVALRYHQAGAALTNPAALLAG